MKEKPASFEWFKVYPRQWLLDSEYEALSTTTVGAWFLLTVRAWSEEPQGTLPADEQTLAKWARLKPGEWKRNRDAILALFYPRGKRLGSRFLDTELRRARGFYEARKKGGEAKRDKAREDNELGCSAGAEQVLSGVGKERSSSSDQEREGSGSAERSEAPSRARGNSGKEAKPAEARPVDEQTGLNPSLGDDDDLSAHPAERLRRRLRRRHGRDFDAEAVLHVVREELGRVSLNTFLEKDNEVTTNPAGLTNPIGHYRKLAKTLAAEGQDRITAAPPPSTPDPGICPHCANKGRVGSEYCECAYGRGKREADGIVSAKRRDEAERTGRVIGETPEKVEQANEGAPVMKPVSELLQ
jgi:uncharacterized protein YdaU (DUF1376 family)